MHSTKDWSRVLKAVGAVVISACVLLPLGGCSWLFDLFNQAPVALIDAETTIGEAPLEVLFDASQSYDPDGDGIASYTWEFGDGQSLQGRTALHGFTSSGEYTVLLTVADVGGKTGTTVVSVSVLEPNVETLIHTYEASEGTTFDSGTGLSLKIAPTSDEGQVEVLVAYDATPPQPSQDGVDIRSVYSISLGSVYASQSLGPRSSAVPSSIDLALAIPDDMDPDSAAALVWTSDGWRLAPAFSGDDRIVGLGGDLSTDRRHIHLSLPLEPIGPAGVQPKELRGWWDKTAGKLKIAVAKLKNTFDCSPIYPQITESAWEDRGTYLEKQVHITAPTRGFGGIWFKIDVEPESEWAKPPSWDPVNRFEVETILMDMILGEDGWYLAPSGKPGTLTLRFPSQGGDALVVMSAQQTFMVQVVQWIFDALPSGDVAEGILEFVWGFLESATQRLESGTLSGVTSWGDAIEKGKGLLVELGDMFAEEAFTEGLARHLLKKYQKRFATDTLKEATRMASDNLVDFVMRPIQLTQIAANILTYVWTLASEQAGYCSHGRCTWETFARDRELPTVPERPSGTATSATVIELTWQASEDNAGIAEYWVFREGEKVSSVQLTSFSDSGLTPSTQYCYTIVARDLGGNSSPSTDAVCVTTKSAGSELADLTPIVVSASGVYDAGDPVEVGYSIANRGNMSASDFEYSFYLASTAWGTDYLLDNFRWSDMLPMSPGAEYSGSETVEIPSVPAGNYYVTCFVDSSRAVSEADENNNIGSTHPNTITIGSTPNVSLVSVEVSGLAIAPEKTTTDYICKAYYSDGSERDVTDDTSWKENSSSASFSSPGSLDVEGLLWDRTCTLTATYSDGEETRTDSLSITLKNGALEKVLERLDISGPSYADEDTTASFSCTAHYSNGDAQVVTSDSTWVCGCSYAEFTADGQLEVKSLSSDKSCTISATYTDSTGTATDSVVVLLRNAESPKYLERIEIDGLSQINENTSEQFECIAYFSNGSSEPITGSATWGESCPWTDINGSGLLTVGEQPYDRQCEITASYSYGGAQREDKLEILLLAGPEPVTLDKLAIAVPTQVFRHCEYDLTCTATLTNGDEFDATDEVSWEVIPHEHEAAISQSGHLTIGDIFSSEADCHVRVKYDYGGVEKTAVMPVRVVYTEPGHELVDVEIQGPSKVFEDSETNYACIAYFADGDRDDVHWAANWSLGNSYASVDEHGVVEVLGLSQSRTTTLYVEYEYDGRVRTDSKQIRLTDTPGSQVGVTFYAQETQGSRMVPVSGVEFSGTDGDGRDFVETTDSEGYAYVVGSPGRWWVDAIKSGYYPEDRDYPVSDCILWGFQMRPITNFASLDVYVFEDSGLSTPIVGATVTVTMTSGETFEGQTDFNGLVVVSGAEGDWRFTVTKAGYGTITWRQIIYEETGQLDLWAWE